VAIIACQNDRICTAHPARARHQLTVHIGGYRAMPATGDRHAARLVFQSASVLIADLVRPGTAPPRMADQMHVSRFGVRRYTIVIAAWSRE
jgi:hypothetical protein